MIRLISAAALLLTAARGAEPWFVQLLPPEVSSVWVIDVARVKQLPGGRTLLHIAMPEEWRFPEPGEFDAWTDLEELAFCDAPQGSMNFLRGAVGPSQMASLYEPDEPKRWLDYRGVRVMSSRKENGGWAAALAGGVVVGPAPMVRAAIDRHLAGAAPVLSLVPGTADAWIWDKHLGIELFVPAIRDSASLPATLTLRLSDSAAIHAEWIAETEESASEIVARANEALSHRAASRFERRVSRGTRVSASGRRVVLDLSMAAEDLERQFQAPPVYHHPPRCPPPRR